MTGSPRLLTPGNAVAALAILTGLALVLLRPEAPQAAAEPEDSRAALVLLELQTKLLAGAARFGPQPGLAGLDQLESFATNPEARRALASFQAYVRPRESRKEALHSLPAPGERDALDALVARAIEKPSTLSPGERATLLERMGWFGRLLLASTDPASASQVESESLRAAAIGSAAVFLLLFAGLAGVVLLSVAVVRRRDGSLPFRFQPAPERAHLYFQSFAVYLWGMILFSSMATAQRPDSPLSLAGSAGAIGLSMILGLAYPLLRGVPFPEWRMDLGLHCGRGVFREAAAGMAAYLAMLPLLGIGLGLTMLLQKLGAGATGAPPEPISHPIYGLLPGATSWTLMLLFGLAAGVAPLAEEAMFRGALYGSLRGIAGKAVSLCAMSFVFAALHPQGVYAIPGLMAISISFGVMREWRESLVAGAVAHGLHNGALLLGMRLLLGPV